jgi:hypothetical protein
MLSVVLGVPDHIWLRAEHLIWISAVVIVSVANTAVVVVVALKINGEQLPRRVGHLMD